MSDIEVESEVATEGRIVVSSYDVDELREKYDDWDQKSKEEKLELVQGEEPLEEVESENTAVDGQHEVIVDNLDPSQDASITASHVAIGVDNTSPSSSDASLNDEKYRTDITSSTDEGTSLATSTFIDGTEANGHTFVEGGLVTGSASENWKLLNHSTFNSVVKDSSKSLTIDVDLTYTAT